MGHAMSPTRPSIVALDSREGASTFCGVVPRHNSVHLLIQQHRNVAQNPFCYDLAAMFDLFRLWCGAIIRTFRSRSGLMLENLALRQQLAVLKRKHPRPRLGPLDKLFWVVWHSDSGPDGRKHSFSFCQKRSPAGTGLDSDAIGRCCAKRENESALADESANRSVSLSSKWSWRIQVGVRPAFTANSLC